MTRDEKKTLVDELAHKLKQSPNFYLVDMGGMTVEQSNKFRATLKKANLEVHMAKNTLIKKALELAGGNNQEVYDLLKASSSIILANDNATEPAKVLKSFLAGAEKPVLKGAYIEASTYGPGTLDALTTLKGKQELLGEIVGLLQSPIQQVIAALQSGGQTIAGVLTSLSERTENH